MKIVKISDNQKINIEQIYSLERHNNYDEISDWERRYNECIAEFTDNPPDLVIDNKICSIDYNKDVSADELKSYTDALDKYIKTIVGERPTYIESYCVILSTGLKINIPKSINDKID